MRFHKIVWSPVEEEYLKKHINESINQLCINLAKSRNAIVKKIKELQGSSTATKTTTKKPAIRNTKIGKRKDLGYSVRSGWEANVWRFFKTQKDIIKIEYEPKTFLFTDFGITNGTLSYTPDFKITYNDNQYLWVEVKGGWLKQQDKTKIRRFKKYFPEEFKHLVAIPPSSQSKTTLFFKEEVVNCKWYYQDLKKEYQKSIPFWE